MTATASRQAGVLVRLGRVARQLVVPAIAAGAYYLLMTRLLDLFGPQAFLYALLALAAVMALAREFGPDVKALPARLRERRARRAEAGADETGSGPPAPAAPEVTTRAELEASFQEQLAGLEQGTVTPEAFDQFTREFRFIDGHGKFWTIQLDSEQWAYYQGGSWHAGVPLGQLSRAGGASV